MDQEQIERAIAFILDQQAKFAAGMEDLRDRQEGLQAQQEAFQSEMDEMKSVFRDSTARLDRIEAIQQTQAGLITNVALQLQEVGRRIDKLADLQQHTDGRLDIVISQSDELIRRWGEQQKPQ